MNKITAKRNRRFIGPGTLLQIQRKKTAVEKGLSAKELLKNKIKALSLRIERLKQTKEYDSIFEEEQIEKLRGEFSNKKYNHNTQTFYSALKLLFLTDRDSLRSNLQIWRSGTRATKQRKLLMLKIESITHIINELSVLIRLASVQ